MPIVQKQQFLCGSLKSPEDIVRSVRDYRIEKIDFRFTDMFGHWRSALLSTSALDLSSFADRGGFPGSAISWCKDVQESDALVAPDPESAFLDPFAPTPTLVLICNVVDLPTSGWCALDSRSIGKRAEAILEKTHIAGAPIFRIELERRGFYEPSMDQARWFDSHQLHELVAESPAGSEDRAAPTDVLRHMRREIAANLRKAGVEIEDQHLAAGGGQGAFTMRPATLTRAADYFMIYSYVVGGIVGKGYGWAAPRCDRAFPRCGRMRINQSIWRGERAVFRGDGFVGTSAIMRHYMAGLAEHTPALLDILALTNSPPLDSASNFDPRIEWGARQERNFAVTRHISISSPYPNAMDVEFLCPNASCNPYLAFAAILMAGVDGFQYRMYNVDPEEPIAKFFGRPDDELAVNVSAAGALETDHEFLLTDQLFTPGIIAVLSGRRPLVRQRSGSCV